MDPVRVVMPAKPNLEKLPLDGSIELVVILVVDSSSTGELVTREMIDQQIKIIHDAYPRLHFEFIIHRVPHEIHFAQFTFIPGMPQLSILVHHSIELFVLQRDAYTKLCKSQPLRWDEIRSYRQEYYPIENVDPIHFRVQFPSVSPDIWKAVMDWIQNGFVIPPYVHPIQLVCRYVTEPTKTRIHPEVIIHLHHPCPNPSCVGAPDIIKEALEGNFELHVHRASIDMGCLDLPTFDIPRLVGSYPALAAMSRETYQKLLRKEDIQDDEVDIFGTVNIQNTNRRVRNTRIDFSIVNIRKWLGLEKETMP